MKLRTPVAFFLFLLLAAVIAFPVSAHGSHHGLRQGQGNHYSAGWRQDADGRDPPCVTGRAATPSRQRHHACLYNQETCSSPAAGTVMCGGYDSCSYVIDSIFWPIRSHVCCVR